MWYPKRQNKVAIICPKLFSTLYFKEKLWHNVVNFYQYFAITASPTCLTITCNFSWRFSLSSLFIVDSLYFLCFIFQFWLALFSFYSLKAYFVSLQKTLPQEEKVIWAKYDKMSWPCVHCFTLFWIIWLTKKCFGQKKSPPHPSFFPFFVCRQQSSLSEKTLI